jgi:hypothetical protein
MHCVGHDASSEHLAWAAGFPINGARRAPREPSVGYLPIEEDCDETSLEVDSRFIAAIATGCDRDRDVSRCFPRCHRIIGAPGNPSKLVGALSELLAVAMKDVSQPRGSPVLRPLGQKSGGGVYQHTSHDMTRRRGMSDRLGLWRAAGWDERSGDFPTDSAYSTATGLTSSTSNSELTCSTAKCLCAAPRWMNHFQVFRAGHDA